MASVAKFRLGWNGDPSNSRLRGHRVRQSSNDLYESNSPAPVVDSPKCLAGTFVRSRSVDRLNDGESRARYGASGIPRDGRNACGGSCLCIPGGHFQSPRIQSPQDRLKTKAARFGETSFEREVVVEPKSSCSLRRKQ